MSKVALIDNMPWGAVIFKVLSGLWLFVSAVCCQRVLV